MRSLLLLIYTAVPVRAFLAPLNKNQRSSFLYESATATLTFELHPSISQIDSEKWNLCGESPFLQHAWIACLEQSGCASSKTGWSPQHIEIRNDNVTIGFVPMYVKGHSLGEFIFDQGWAEAAYKVGIDYYPKLLVAVPFTPATGERILWHHIVKDSYSTTEIAKLNQAVASFLKQLAVSNDLSSVHFNFCLEGEADDIVGPVEVESSPERNDIFSFLQSPKDDYLRRTSIQYHWTNENPKNDRKPFSSFDDYLQCFKSKRRINIKRERRYVLEDCGIRIDALRGKQILEVPGMMDRIFEIYVSTIDKMYFGRQYLNLEFFRMLGNSSFVENLCFMCARKSNAGETIRAEDVFAGTFNIVKDGVFYGRYWGCLEGHDVKNLHFETCYWAAIEYCIDNGLQRMEPGAGGGDYKWARGFDPALIHSVHYITNPGLRQAVSRFLKFETGDNLELQEYLRLRRNTTEVFKGD